MKKYIGFLYFIILFSCTNNSNKTPKTPNGFFDLSNWNFENDGIVKLDGKWDFYWNKLYTPQDFVNDSLHIGNAEKITVPGTWNDKTKIIKAHDNFGVATYRIKVKTNTLSENLGIKVIDISSSYKLWINDKLVLQNGTVSNNKNEMKPEYKSKIKIFKKPADEFYITVQVSNYYYCKGGIWESISIGLPEDIINNRILSAIGSFFLTGSFLILALYHVLIYFLRKTEIESFWSGILSFAALTRLLFTNERFINYVYNDLGASFIIRVEYLSVYSVALLSLSMYIHNLFKEESSKKIHKFVFFVVFINSFLILFFPVSFFTLFNLFFSSSGVLLISYFIYVLIIANINRRKLATLSLLGLLIVLVLTINDVLYSQLIINSYHLVPLGVLFFLLIQAFITSSKISDSFLIIENTSKKLNESNIILENKIAELAESENKFKNIVQQTSDIICITDLNGIFKYVSPSVKRMLGFEPEDWVGRSAWEDVHPDDIEMGKNAVKNAAKGISDSNVRYRLRKIDGTYIYAQVRPSFVWENNKITSVIFIIQNINDRVLAEERKLEYEKTLELKVEERTQALSLKTSELEAEKKKADELLLNILPEETAEELKKYGRAKARTYGMVSVIYTDFKNFTGISERTVPELLVAELDFCFCEFDKIIQKYNIEKIKTVGDAYLCVAGIPTPEARHAFNAIKAAIEMRDFIKLRKDEKEKMGEIPFEIRIGVHSGPIVAGIVGLKKFAYDIWGETVNLAARMEQNSIAGKINISSATFELVKNEFLFEDRGKIEVKNKGYLNMYFVENKT